MPATLYIYIDRYLILSYLGHWRVWKLLDDVRVLLPLELVEELRPEHDVEILFQSGRHLLDGVLPPVARGAPLRVGGFVLDVVLVMKNVKLTGHSRPSGSLFTLVKHQFSTNCFRK